MILGKRLFIKSVKPSIKELNPSYTLQVIKATSIDEDSNEYIGLWRLAEYNETENNLTDILNTFSQNMITWLGLYNTFTKHYMIRPILSLRINFFILTSSIWYHSRIGDLDPIAGMGLRL